MGSLHKDLTLDNIHPLPSRVYADISARDADIFFNTNTTNINKLVRVDSPLSYYILASITPTWLEFSSVGNDEFTDLTDTPSSYSGQGLKLVQVNSGATALEFTDDPTLNHISVNGGVSNVSISLNSTSAALLLNRLTTTQRDALTPLQGMTIFNTTTGHHETYNGTSWVRTSTGGDVTKVGTPVDNQIAIWTGDGTLEGSSGLTFNGSILTASEIVITGNLTVQGTTTTLDTTTLLVEDKNIEMGVVTTPTDITADGGGITLKGTTDKTINWINATDSWTFNQQIDVGTNKIINVVDPTQAQDAATKNYVDTLPTMGDVFKVGTPIDNQIAVWTGATTIEGTSALVFDGQLKTGDGTELLPAYSFSSDPNTGMRRVSEDVLGFSAKGFDVLQLTAETDADHFLKITARKTGIGNDGILIQTIGTTTDVDFDFQAQGSGFINLNTHATGGGIGIGRELNGFGVIDVEPLARTIGFGSISASDGIDGEVARFSALNAAHTQSQINIQSPNASSDLFIGIKNEVNTSSTTLEVINSNTFSRPSGSFITDGFVVGKSITSTLFTNGANNGTFVLAVVTASTLGITTSPLIVEAQGTRQIIEVNTGNAFFTSSNEEMIFNTSAGEALVISSLNVSIAGTTSIGGISVLTDLTILQNTTQAKRGLLLAGKGYFGGDLSGDGVFINNILNAVGNMQLGIGQFSDYGNSSKNIFRYTVGIAVPNIGSVSGNGSTNTNLNIGNPLSMVGIGHPVPGAAQADIVSQLDVKAGFAATIGIISRGATSQTADLFQARKSDNTVLTSIGSAGEISQFGNGTARIKISNGNLIALRAESNGELDIKFFNSSDVLEMEFGYKESTDFVNLHSSGAGNFSIANLGGNLFLAAPGGALGISTLTTISLVAEGPDTTPVFTVESEGTNGKKIEVRVGDRDPNGNITGAGGDIYHRDNGAESATYESKEVTTGTSWFRRNTYPSKDFEINTQAEYDALFTAGVMTITEGTTLFINLQVSGPGRFALTGGFDLTISGRNTSEAGITYTGTGTLVSGTGQLQCFDAVDLNGDLAQGGTFIDITGTMLIDNVTLRRWTVMGTVKTGSFIFRHIDMVDITQGFTVVDPSSTLMHAVAIFGTTFTGSMLTYSNKNRLGANANFTDMRSRIFGSTATFFNLALTSVKNTPITISNIQITNGNLFKKTTVSNATINSVANSAISTGTLTAMADNGSGGTTVFSTATYFNSEELTILGTTSYNGTHFIFNVVAGVSFDIPISFVADDATGSSNSVRLALTLAASHGIVAQDNLKIISTNFYNGFVVALNLPSANVVIVNGTFVSTNTGAIEIGVGLDQSDGRVITANNFGFRNFANIACAHVNDNSTANGTIVNNTFTDVVFGTVGSALIASSTMERWRLVDEINGTFEYIGLDQFDGLITFDFTVESSGGTVDFRFKWLIDKGAGFVDLDDVVESLVAIGSDAQSVTKTFPLAIEKGQKIKPQITRNSGSSGITTIYASIYATG